MDERVVLAVEDSDGDFYVIQLALKEANLAIQVCRVEDGEQAISFLERSGKFDGAPRPQLILLNINLPRKSGFEVLEYAKAHDAFRSIPVVMFTSSSDARERQKALALGAEEYLTKPMRLHGLISELSRVCARFLADSHTRSPDGGASAA